MADHITPPDLHVVLAVSETDYQTVRVKLKAAESLTNPAYVT